MKKSLGLTKTELIGVVFMVVGIILAEGLDYLLFGMIVFTPGLLFFIYKGTKKDLGKIMQIEQTDPCPTCDGSGRVAKEEVEQKSGA